MKKLRIVLVEDQTILRHSLRALIEDQPDLEVVGEATDGEQAVRVASSARPDIVVMDLTMPRMDGIQATLALKRDCPDLKVLVLTVHESKSHVRRVLAGGRLGVHREAVGRGRTHPSASRCRRPRGVSGSDRRRQAFWAFQTGRPARAERRAGV